MVAINLLIALLLAPVSQALEIKTSRVELSAELDRLHAAMEGPILNAFLPIEVPKGSSEIWLLGHTLEVLENEKPSPQYLCHSRLGLAPLASGSSEVKIIRPDPKAKTTRALSISQGQSTMRFPEGFGYKVGIDQGRLGLIVSVQLQNSVSSPQPRKLRILASVQYVAEQEGAAAKLKALKPARLTFAKGKPLNGGEGPQPNGHGMFFVPPGKHRYTAEVLVPKDASRRVHYVRMHLHAFAKSLELVDPKNGQTIWKGMAETNLATGTLSKIDAYSSREGFAVRPGSTYQLVAEYHNPTDQPVDAMAFMTLFAAND